VRVIKRILVAIKDPSAGALPALAKAAQLAQALDAKLVLFPQARAATAPCGTLYQLPRGLPLTGSLFH